MKKFFGIWLLRCPNCFKGRLFTNPNPYNLKTITDMPKACPNCGLDFKVEIGFYFGAAYISYVVSCFFMLGIMGTALITMGWVPKWVVGLAIVLELIFATYILRFSRALWLSIYWWYVGDK